MIRVFVVESNELVGWPASKWVSELICSGQTTAANARTHGRSAGGIKARLTPLGMIE
jgi:hypothetical protein